jgi:hypothetical protein
MYKRIPNPPTNFTAAAKHQMVQLEWDWQDERPYITSAAFYSLCKRSDEAEFQDNNTNCDTKKQGQDMRFTIPRSSTRVKTNIFGLQNGVDYDFAVYTIGNDSQPVFQYGIAPQASTYVPSPPATLNARISSSDSAFVFWSKPQFDGGSPLLGYMLMNQCARYYQGGDLVQTDASGISPYSLNTNSGIDCLDSTNPSKFSVIAFNANGASQPSQTVELWGEAAKKPPGVPTNIKVDIGGVDKTKLSWTAPSDNGSPILSYEMRYSVSPTFDGWTGAAGVDTCVSGAPLPPETSCVAQPLELGKLYYFQVRAINTNGPSDWSIVHASIVGAPDRPSIRVASTTPISNDRSNIFIAWEQPNTNGSPITGYQLEYSTNPDFAPDATIAVPFAATDLTYSLNSVANGTVYYFRVLATNSRGASPWSDPVQVIPYFIPADIAVTPNTGLTLGNQPVVITGANLSGATSVTIDGLACLNFSVVDNTTIHCLTPPNPVVGAKDVIVTTPGGSATAVGGFTYGEPQLALDIDKVALGISIAASERYGTVKTDHQTATVKTDDPRGFVLDFSMRTAETALVHTSAPANRINASNALVNAQPLADNTWGYSLQNPSADRWLGAPPLSNPKSLKTTTNPTTGGMTGAGDSTVVYFGSKVNISQPTGSYIGRMIYSAVGNY